MSDVDLTEFFKYSRPKSKPCAVAFAVEQLAAKERKQLDAALAHDKGFITNGAIREWLAKRGHEMNVAAVTAHRNKVCACGRNA